MIDRISKNKYLVRVYNGTDANGRRRSTSKVIHGDRSVAETYELELLQRKNRGQPLSETKLTIDAFYKEWKESVRHQMKEKTILWLDGQYNNHVGPALGHVRLAALTPLEVEQFYAAKVETGLKGGSIKSFHALLSMMYKSASRWQYIGQNPMPMVKLPKFQKHEMKCFTPEAARAFMAASYHVLHGLVFRFALQTGLRPEEYLGLKWSYLDFDYRDRQKRHWGRVIVRETVIPGKPGGGWWWSTPKSESSKREVLFPLPLLQELQQHRVTQLEHKMKLGRHYEDHDLVFATPTGTPIKSTMLSYRYFKLALEKAGLPKDFRLYDLRHSWVTLSILAGGDIKTISKSAGHASTAFTLDVYGHVLPEMRENAVDRFSALFGSAAQ